MSFSGGLFTLGVRRLLSPRALALFLLAIVLATNLSWGEVESARLTRAFARQGVWLFAAGLVVPICFLAAAYTSQSWRQRESDWIGTVPLGWIQRLLPTTAGLVVGGTLLSLLAALAAEWAAGSSAPALRWQRSLENPVMWLVDGEQADRWSLSEEMLGRPAPGTVLRLRPTVMPGSGPTANVELSLRALQPDAVAQAAPTVERVETRLFGPRAVDLTLPPSAGAGWLLEVRRGSDGAYVLLPSSSIDVLTPTSSDRGASLELFLRALCALMAGVPLALGFGAWMRAPLAVLLLASLALLPLYWNLGAGWLPLTDLGRAWGWVGEGLVPPAVGPRAWCGTLALGAIGIALARRGLGRGRWLT